MVSHDQRSLDTIFQTYYPQFLDTARAIPDWNWECPVSCGQEFRHIGLRVIVVLYMRYDGVNLIYNKYHYLEDFTRMGGFYLEGA